MGPIRRDRLAAEQTVKFVADHFPQESAAGSGVKENCFVSMSSSLGRIQVSLRFPRSRDAVAVLECMVKLVAQDQPVIRLVVPRISSTRSCWLPNSCHSPAT